jgi:asparagine synthase (glutamine-hydrolysing)
VNPFVCVVDLRGAPLGSEALTPALPGLVAGDGRVELLFDGCWAAAWVPSGFGRPDVARRRGLLAVGNVRLANRAELVRRLGEVRPPVTDLELAMDLFARRGVGALRDLLGDFAFVLWDPEQQAAVAVRDALGVQPLFHQRSGTRVVFTSHVDCLEPGELDREYLARFLAGRALGPTATAFVGIQRVPAGSWMLARLNGVYGERYWSADEFEPAAGVGRVEPAIEEFRELFTRAVANEVDGEAETWAQLSGGLDSSSVVAMACALARGGELPRGLAGTITVVDSLSDGDETRFSDEVVARYGLRNERLVDHWAWQPDAEGPPTFAEPRHFLPFWARDRAMCRVVRGGGEASGEGAAGRVLLSGYGSDQYLSGSFDFIADLLADRQIGPAFSHLTELAVTTRQSFWRLARTHGLGPLRARRRRSPGGGAGVWPDGGAGPSWAATPPADWLAEAAAAPEAGFGGARPRTIFGGQVAAEVANTELLLNRGLFEQGIEVRYPFLFRPLVEFGLRLPVTLRVRPRQQKWILRQALGDVLPTAVRSRTGKGGIDGRIVWSLEREQTLLRRLIANSHLADLGLVRREALAQGFEAARAGLTGNVTRLFFTLALETWLAVRSGWWSRHAAPDSAARPGGPPAPPSLKEQTNVEAGVR